MALSNRIALAATLSLAAVACSASPPAAPRRAPSTRIGAVTVSIIGTNDLHGSMERLPLFAGYLANLRARRFADNGGVVLVDAGDMFQGTLESNLAEGADVVRAYNALGYNAAAVGNHEFDFGPQGPKATPAGVEDDPRGALKDRARGAMFPLLVANIVDAKSGNRIKWPNMPPSTVVEVAGVKVGIIGLTTMSTPFTTMPANFVGLKMASPAINATAEANALRDHGAQLIVITAHIGSKCKDLSNPADLSSCDTGEELFELADALPRGLVNVIVAGHTHAAMAHRINDIAVIESYASGRAFGRVDLRVSPSGQVTAVNIFKPQDICPVDGDGNPVPMAQCKPEKYEDLEIKADEEVAAIVSDAEERAAVLRDKPLGITLRAAVERSYDHESAEGNLFADLMLAAFPDAEVAMTNGGGLRADLPAGTLTYGALFQANPFDNRFALVQIEGRQIRQLLAKNLAGKGGIFSWAGLVAVATCKDGQTALDLKIGGKPLEDKRLYKLVTSDFLASGGDGVIGRLKLPPGAVTVTDLIIRESMAEALTRRGGTLDPATLFSPKARRLSYPGERPVACGKAGSRPATDEPD